MSLFLQSEILRAHGVPHAFSLRAGGVSAPPFASLNLGGAVGDRPDDVAENLRRLLAASGVDERAFAAATQVHGDRVVHAALGPGGVELRAERHGDALPGPVEADALVAAPGAAVGVRTADCVPILLYDPASGAAAAVHAGWRGTVAQIVVRTVEALVRDHGARPESLRAAIGPAIGRCCFEVGADLADRFAADPAFGPDTVERPGPGGPRVDLFLANQRLLGQAGVRAHHVDVLAHCTMCDPARFFSHRRDQGRTGRHLALVLAGRF